LVNITKSQLGFLSGNQLKQLQIHLDNITDGIYTHPANVMAQRIEATTRAFTMKPILDKASKTKILTARQKGVAIVKNSVKKFGSKGARQVGVVGQMIRSNPLNVIDFMLGNSKTNTIKENMLDPTATQFAKFKTWINEKTDKLTKVENLLDPKRFSTEGTNESVKKRFEITTYLLGKEFEANQDKKGFATPRAFIEKTIEKYNQDPQISRYKKKDIDILKKILADYSVDGEISLKKMEDSMDPKTKQAIKILEDVYNDLGEMQVYATAIVRGDAINLINN